MKLNPYKNAPGVLLSKAQTGQARYRLRVTDLIAAKFGTRRFILMTARRSYPTVSTTPLDKSIALISTMNQHPISRDAPERLRMDNLSQYLQNIHHSWTMASW